MAPAESVTTTEDLRAKYRHFVWSNPDAAADEIYVAAALRRANFFELRDFVAVMGVDRLRAVWDTVQRAEPERARKVGGQVARILRHLTISAEKRCA